MSACEGQLALQCALSAFSGIPAMVDLAAMREAVKTLGGDPKKVHPACPTDLTVDHSLQIDFSKWYRDAEAMTTACRRAPTHGRVWRRGGGIHARFLRVVLTDVTRKAGDMFSRGFFFSV